MKMLSQMANLAMIAVVLGCGVGPVRAAEDNGSTQTLKTVAPGSSQFRVAWRHSLGSRPCRFTCGRFASDGSPRLAMLTTSPSLCVCKWNGSKFKKEWEGGRITVTSASDAICLLTLGQQGTPDSLMLFVNNRLYSAKSGGRFFYGQFFKWNGKTYAQTSVESPYMICQSDGAAPSRVAGVTADSVPFSGSIALKNWDELEMNAKTCPKDFFYRDFCVCADFDNDSVDEYAIAKEPSSTGEVVSIIAKDGTTKAETDNRYGQILTTWRPKGSSTTYLVAKRNEHDRNGNPLGGYVYLLRVSDKACTQIWRSDRLDDAIADFQVCDPKGEGADGLVVMSCNQNEAYLTKIVPTEPH